MDQVAAVEKTLYDLQVQVLDMRDLLVHIRSGYPRQIQLENLRDSRYEVMRAIPVVLEEDEGQYVATWYDADLFGYGDREQEALDDLCESIVSLWEVLKRESAGRKLGKTLTRQWAFLQKVIREVA
ncbi:MAG: hypothetical protein QME81_19670 [bacterium]|nr:hypothetical protein [bacterium]